MNTNKYNGWNNYETWNCNLWLDNDGYFEDRIYTHEEIKEYVEESYEYISDKIGNNMFADLLNAAISEIDFREIADNHNADIDEDEDE